MFRKEWEASIDEKMKKKGKVPAKGKKKSVVEENGGGIVDQQQQKNLKVKKSTPLSRGGAGPSQRSQSSLMYQDSDSDWMKNKFLGWIARLTLPLWISF